MIHFLYLVGFAFFVSVVFAVITNGTNKEKFISGLKTFVQFLVVSLVLAWVFYFLPF